MAVTRKLSNGSLMTEWTDEINEIENQYGLINGSGLFNGKGISQDSIVFDKTEHEITLLSQSSRRGDAPTYGKDRSLETFSLALPYFNHKDYVTAQDVQGWRMPGTADMEEALGRVIAEKLEDLRLAADQTREYMKIQAIKGITVDPDGNTLANMFTEFGLTRTDYQVDFDLGTADTEVDLKIATLKRGIAKNAKAGGAIGRIECMVSPEFFDALITHPKMREAYLYYQNSGKQLLRDDLARYESWGIVDMFEHKGILFYSYDAEFNMPDGGTERAISATVGTEGGYSIVRGMRNLYRGYFGPANTLSGANMAGMEIFAYEYRDPKDKYHELEVEMAPLYIISKPKVSWKLISST